MLPVQPCFTCSFRVVGEEDEVEEELEWVKREKRVKADGSKALDWQAVLDETGAPKREIAGE